MAKQFVANGLVVRIQGHPVLVSNVREVMVQNVPTVQFNAKFLDVPENEGVVNTGYDNGVYGGNHRAGYVW